MKKYLFLLILIGCSVESQTPDMIAHDYTVTEASPSFTISHPLDGRYIETIELWWSQIEGCTGLDTPLEAYSLHIQYVDASSFMMDGQEVLGGIWPKDQFAQVILNDLQYMRGDITRHEMMHYILWMNKLEDFDHKNQLSIDCAHLTGD